MVLLTKNRLIAARDPHGFRPLALGRLGDAWIVCSETCALDLIGATYVRDVEPGELLIISDGGLRSIKPYPPAQLAHCVFEHVYFARPDSYVFGRSVNEVRTALGPDPRARGAGRSRRRGADSRLGRLRGDRLRGKARAAAAVRVDPEPLRRPHVHPAAAVDPRLRREGEAQSGPEHPRGPARRAVDDSIVRGTTSRKIVRLVKAAGAREVHVRISCPPTVSPCFYGVDTPSRKELIGATH